MKKIGNLAEQLACRFLENQGLKLITRNFQCKCGEIDLIMQDNNSLVFTEVRYRKNIHYGSAAESVTINKQNRLMQTADYYLQQQKITDEIPCRFDVIAFNHSLDIEHIQWIKDAF